MIMRFWENLLKKNLETFYLTILFFLNNKISFWISTIKTNNFYYK